MTLAKLFNVPADSVGTLINPPKIQAMMCGVHMAYIEASGRVTLLYVDGTTEKATLPSPIPSEFFAIVSAVQDKRTKARGDA